jgi:hypothetical protein
LACALGNYGHGVPRMPTDKPAGKPISTPLVATTFYRDIQHNNQIDIDDLGGKRVSNNTRRGDDGHRKASRAIDNTMSRGSERRREMSVKKYARRYLYLTF